MLWSEPWASEGFFPGAGEVAIFPKIFPWWGQSGEICFYASQLTKQPFLLIISKSRGGAKAPPSNAHGLNYCRQNAGKL